MEDTIPWYSSSIVRQQIVMIIVGAIGLFGVTTDLDVDATVGAVLAGVAAIIPVWTLLSRLFQPTPPITETAVKKEAEMKAEGKL